MKEISKAQGILRRSISFKKKARKKQLAKECQKMPFHFARASSWSGGSALLPPSQFYSLKTA
jgi:hypothetical protein